MFLIDYMYIKSIFKYNILILSIEKHHVCSNFELILKIGILGNLFWNGIKNCDVPEKQ